MDKELQTYYENYWDLFSRPGWEQFIADLTASAEGAQHLVNTADAPDVFRAQGDLACLKRIINFKKLQEEGYAQILEDEGTNE